MKHLLFKTLPGRAIVISAAVKIGVFAIGLVAAVPSLLAVVDTVASVALAAGGDSPQILELLLKYKGDPNLIGPRGEPLLHIAAGEFRKENIDLLLKYGVDINIHEKNDSTAAQVAARLGRFDITAYLLEKGLSYNLEGLAKSVEARRVPPNSEAQRWKDKVIEMLKERGVKFPAFTPRGITP